MEQKILNLLTAAVLSLAMTLFMVLIYRFDIVALPTLNDSVFFTVGIFQFIVIFIILEIFLEFNK